MLFAILCLTGTVVPPVELQQSTVTRFISFQIPLESDGPGGFWGPADRKTDHGTIAMNPALDIVVIYHADREDLLPGTGYLSTLKQVKAAFFRYDGGSSNTWTHVKTELIGSVTHDPEGILLNDIVKCERPDVTTVGDRFFAAWTRIYDPATGDPDELAVLEGAWIRWDASQQKFLVFDHAASGVATGRGILLDSSYHVRQCAGVPDAVALEVGPSLWSVGIAYVHQWQFGVPNSWIRRFELRLATCSITAGDVTTSTKEPNLSDNVPFIGDTDGDAGLVLPDLAQGTSPTRFALAYEKQFGTGAGQILLELREKNPLTGEWDALDSHSFGSAGSPAERRRVNLSSHPVPGTADAVSIAFMKRLAGGDWDIVYEEWVLTSGWTQRLWPLGRGWVNTAADDIHPFPVHGKKALDPLLDFRRGYASRNVPPATASDLIRYDFGSNTTVSLTTQDGLKRPAASYVFHEASGTEYVALCWEQDSPAGRIRPAKRPLDTALAA